MTNALWLQFILVAMRERLSASRSPLQSDEESGRLEAADANLQKTYERRLAAVEDMLNPEKLKAGLHWSAKAVLDHALRRRWLVEEDIVGYDCDDEK